MASGGVTFDPYMAGERTSIEQKTGAFQGLTLATTRTHLLSAIVEGLIKAGAGRLPLLAATGTPLLPAVLKRSSAFRCKSPPLNSVNSVHSVKKPFPVFTPC